MPEAFCFDDAFIDPELPEDDESKPTVSTVSIFSCISTVEPFVSIFWLFGVNYFFFTGQNFISFYALQKKWVFWI